MDDAAEKLEEIVGRASQAMRLLANAGGQLDRLIDLRATPRIVAARATIGDLIAALQAELEGK